MILSVKIVKTGSVVIVIALLLLYKLSISCLLLMGSYIMLRVV